MDIYEYEGNIFYLDEGDFIFHCAKCSAPNVIQSTEEECYNCGASMIDGWLVKPENMALVKEASDASSDN